LDYPERDTWVTRLCAQLLRGSSSVLHLFAKNPFPDHPPRYVRAVLYDYAFTDSAVRARSGLWWVRTRVGDYVPPIALRSQPAATVGTRSE
jgi:hypothetical protein